MESINMREVPERDEFYLGMAFWAASKSKDPNTQCGAFIIGKDNSPIGWGYNGPPRKIKDESIKWTRPEKYDYIIHAEVNAISHSKASLEGATIYVTAKPCKNCILNIINSGISRVVYFPFLSKDEHSMLKNADISNKTDELARLAGIDLIEFKGSLKWMKNRIDWMQSSGII